MHLLLHLLVRLLSPRSPSASSGNPGRVAVLTVLVCVGFLAALTTPAFIEDHAYPAAAVAGVVALTCGVLLARMRAGRRQRVERLDPFDRPDPIE